MLKIKERLFGTILKDQEKYDNRYVFKGELKELVKYGFKVLKENDAVEELKSKVGNGQEVYSKKSGLGYFIIFKDDEDLIFMSGVPVWWIGDEEKTNYYEDLDNLIKDDLVEKVNENKEYFYTTSKEVEEDLLGDSSNE